MTRVGVDTGGTFTDVVDERGAIVKVPSRPDDPAAAVAAGVDIAGGASVLAHGTTVATNALLERNGGRVALITTCGHRDVVEIARQARPSLYDQWADRPEPLVPRELRFELGQRTAGAPAIPSLPSDLDAVAVCLLHADHDPQQEAEVAAALHGIEVVVSSDVSPEYRDYERTVTTVADAYLRRPCRAYLGRLVDVAPDVLVLTSAGGLVPLEEAYEHPVSLLLSGPAGGVLAAAAIARDADLGDCVSFDMGGTSTDVCLIRSGRPDPAAERVVAGLPIRRPSVDVHTIGAGGGSIARIDSGGALIVGPESAGAEPGPVCYGRGGVRPTVTDADLVAGRIPVEGLPGLGRLDMDASRRALGEAALAADGVIAVVDQAMVQAIRSVSVERGVDAAGLSLLAFGGAGPLHACALAGALGMREILVPPRAGVFSAAGILSAPRQVDLVRSWPSPLDHAGAQAAAADLGAFALSQLRSSAVAEVLFDCRYEGQSHELTVESVEAFPEEHRARNGFTMADRRVEVIAIRSTARQASGIDMRSFPSPDRRGPVTGPAVIAEADCTIWVAEGWRADVDALGCWRITRSR